MAFFYSFFVHLYCYLTKFHFLKEILTGDESSVPQQEILLEPVLAEEQVPV